jgi:hypothetical protein
MAAMASLEPAVKPHRARVPGGDGRIRTPARRKSALTRRGRLVAAGAAALAVTALSMVLATTARATHSGSPAPGPGVSRVIVESGQSLWSLAGEYDPHADPRVVVDRILQLNSLSDTQVQAGAVLWVPRG